MKKTAFILFALLVVACWLGAQQNEPPANPPAESKPAAPAESKPAPPAESKPAAPAESKPSAQEAPKVNPVKATAESLAKGKKTYAIDCAMCHGENGDGKGDLAADLKNVTDFTAPDALKSRADGELFTIIRKGKGDMPPEGDRAKSDDVWNLVNYIRSFAKKKE